MQTIANRMISTAVPLTGNFGALMATSLGAEKKGPAAREIAAIAEEIKQICDSMAQGKRASA